MIVLRLRSKADHSNLLMKVKKMKKFTQEIEDCLEDAYEDEPEYRDEMYEDDDMEDYKKPKSRYSSIGRRGRM